MAKAGRPTKYDPSFCKRVVKYMSNGDSKTAVAARLGITKETLYQWCDPNGEFYNKKFSDSIRKGMAKSQLFWEEIGKNMAINNQGNATAWIYNMKNRFRDEWYDMMKSDVTSGGETIKTNTIVLTNFKENETTG